MFETKVVWFRGRNIIALFVFNFVDVFKVISRST